MIGVKPNLISEKYDVNMSTSSRFPTKQWRWILWFDLRCWKEKISNPKKIRKRLIYLNHFSIRTFFIKSKDSLYASRAWMTRGFPYFTAKSSWSSKARRCTFKSHWFLSKIKKGANSLWKVYFNFTFVQNLSRFLQARWFFHFSNNVPSRTKFCRSTMNSNEDGRHMTHKLDDRSNISKIYVPNFLKENHFKSSRVLVEWRISHSNHVVLFMSSFVKHTD